MSKKTKVTLEKLNVTVEKIATLMVEGFGSVRGDIAALQTDMIEVKRGVADIKEDVGAYGKAIDADAKTIINHDTRIKKLEHAR